MEPMTQPVFFACLSWHDNSPFLQRSKRLVYYSTMNRKKQEIPAEVKYLYFSDL
jgi:hypothetical protein